MKKITFILLLSSFFCRLSSQEIVISGWQESDIEYTLEQTIYVPEGVTRISVSLVQPQDFSSLTYHQKVINSIVKFSTEPPRKEQDLDQFGNSIQRFHWDNPPEIIKFSAVLKTKNSVKLSELKDQSTFPVETQPSELKWFLESSDLIQVDDPSIIKKATEITRECHGEIEAIRAVLHFVVDHMHYTLIPKQYDALYALQTGQGNCQNYSHLSAALLRAVGIPVRIINGVTVNKNYTVPVDQSEFSFEMAEGRHSWIEAYLSDFGWLPFDAQQTEFFVSNRYLRIEFGRDNNETIQDGLVKWTHTNGAQQAVPRLEEIISSNFLEDRFEFTAEAKLRNIRKLLLTPPFSIETSPLALDQFDVENEKEDKISKKDTMASPEDLNTIDYTKLHYSVPMQFGNLDFPRNFDFLSAKFQEADLLTGTGEIRRNFMVETAEYITGKKQFAQMFILDQPILLKDISLALHSFGGEGVVWIDISDDQAGKPSQNAFSSEKRRMTFQNTSTGYDWVNFNFGHQDLLLTPGKYWISLNFSGSPIVNWFYSYGKPVGPVEGTRSRKWGSRDWGNILSFEFNYQITGLASTGIKKD
jgi:hypothetical protein